MPCLEGKFEKIDYQGLSGSFRDKKQTRYERIDPHRCLFEINYAKEPKGLHSLPK